MAKKLNKAAGEKQPEDTRDAETQRLTSHLNAFNPDADAEPQGEDAVSIPTVELPDDTKKLHELLKEVQAQNASTRSEIIIKRAKVDAIVKKLHTLGQGAPAPLVTINSAKAVSAMQSQLAEDMVLEDLARKFNVVRKLSEKYKAAIAERDAVIVERDALKSEIETLKSKET